jgi:hypothetical protein
MTSELEKLYVKFKQIDEELESLRRTSPKFISYSEKSPNIEKLPALESNSGIIIKSEAFEKLTADRLEVSRKMSKLLGERLNERIAEEADEECYSGNFFPCTQGNPGFVKRNELGNLECNCQLVYLECAKCDYCPDSSR